MEGFLAYVLFVFVLVIVAVLISASNSGSKRAEAEARVKTTAQAAEALAAGRMLGRLHGLVVAGGSGYPLRKDQGASLVFDETGACLVGAGEEERPIRIGYDQIRRLEFGGPGVVTTGGDVVVGAFGVEGPLKGMLIAKALTKTTTRAVIRLDATKGEVFLRFEGATPETLRMELSAVLRRIEAAKADAHTHADPGDLVEDLERLTRLLDSGALSHEEFERAKARLLMEVAS